LGKAAQHEQKENSVSKTMRRQRETNSLYFFPRHDMDCSTVFKDNGVNEAVSQGLGLWHSAGNGIRRSRSSSSESLQQEPGERSFIQK